LFQSDRVEELSRRIAQRSFGAVWQRVVHRIPTLAGSEVRGYIRARAGTIVLRETNLMVAEEDLRGEAVAMKLYHVALERVIDLVVQQSQKERQPAAARKVA
jgi:hypothetical protein